MISLVKLLLLLTIFLTPLLGAMNGFGYEQIKVSFFIFSISLIGFMWMGKGIRWTGISKIAGVFILILLITSLIGTDLESSLFGKQPYFQGWILYSYLYLFYLIVKTVNIKPEIYAVVLSFSALIVSILAIKDWILLNLLNINLPTYAGRVVSTFGQPNFYAGFLLLTLPFSYLLFTNSHKKLQILGWGGGLISLIGIMVSYSRSTILLALMLIILGLIGQLRVKKLILAVLVVLIVAVFLSVNFSSGFVWKEVLQPSITYNPDLTKQSVENRVYIWPQAFKIASEEPLSGYGLENINKSFTEFFQKYKHPLFEENLNISPVLISLKELNLDRTHSYILDLLLFSGLFGILSWLALLGMLFWRLIQLSVDRHQSVLVVSLIIYLVWVQFQNQSVVHLVYFWFLAGLIDRNDKQGIDKV